jgi:hypothetical protein
MKEILHDIGYPILDIWSDFDMIEAVKQRTHTETRTGVWRVFWF